jgi:hypothetical protein
VTRGRGETCCRRRVRRAYGATCRSCAVHRVINATYLFIIVMR